MLVKGAMLLSPTGAACPAYCPREVAVVVAAAAVVSTFHCVQLDLRPYKSLYNTTSPD